ncbi:MAG: heavy metal translocating P-type ATPase [Eubacteriales bacterium]|nr:heavy metal translocating P-type ATPase [Eubacteriales bacterium]
MKKEKYDVRGMTCSACSTRVEKTVEKLEGISNVSVNLLTNTMQVEYDENKISGIDITDAVRKAGYKAFLYGGTEGLKGEPKEVTKARDVAADEINEMKKRLIWSFVFLIPLMFISMGHMFVQIGHENGITLGFSQFLLLIPIIFLNRKYFLVGFKNLWLRSPNMDSLIALGATAATAYGIFAIFRIGYGLGTGNMEIVDKYMMDIYFESAAMILTLITLGKYLETKSKGKTGEAIEKLLNLAPKTVTIEKDGEEITISTDELKVGDILLIRPGESIGADGEIIKGSTSIDESSITGESMPVEKQIGDKVISATINKSGFIKVTAEKVGGDSTINQIIKLVDEASGSKAPIAKMADKIAGIFVPVVIVISIISAIVWLAFGATFEFALSTMISVLVISCPCALGLATPVAIMVGTGKGAENGILIKSGEALEIAHSIDTVVLDKTGTITEGKPIVTDIQTYGIEEEGLLAIAKSLETASEHPLAEAIVDYADKRGIASEEIKDFQAIFGRGIKGSINDTIYFAGNKYLMEGEEIYFENLEPYLNQLADMGKTPLIFAKEKEIIGIIAVADMEKETSREAIEKFKALNIDVVMLTGDNKRTAEAIRKKLGIPKVIAEVMPADKEKHVAVLQGQGHKVAMIGDGVNDGPALAKADVGIAIGAGTDVAIESADAVLMRNDLLDAVTAVRLSKAVIRNIKENLFWAFFYNSLGIPLAAGLLFPSFGLRLSPMFGAAAMSLSSVCVVLNALRLKRFKTDRLIEKLEEKREMKYELNIQGMMCQHCKKHVEEALNKIQGVSAQVILEEGKAVVTCEKEIPMEEFKAVIEEAGYKII